MSGRVVVNGAFRGQMVTGQQRYASEVARELLTRYPRAAQERTPNEWWQASPLRTWIWAQLIGLGLRAKDHYLLTLTSRGPVFAYRHVIVVHDLFVLTNPEWFSKAYVVSHVPILRLQLLTAKIVVVVSEPVRDQVRKLVGPKKRIIVVPNAPAQIFMEDHSQEDIEKTCAGHFLEPDKFILSVGSQDPRKNLGRLIEAYLMLPVGQRLQCPLVLVGGSSSVFGKISLPNDGTIRRLGYVSDSDLARLYAGARAVVFPPLAEGFGLPAIEALRSGARVIVSDIPILKWVCGPYATYVDPHSSLNIANSLSELMTSSRAVDYDVFTPKAYIDQRFSWTAGVRVLASELMLEELNGELADDYPQTG